MFKLTYDMARDAKPFVEILEQAERYSDCVHEYYFPQFSDKCEIIPVYRETDEANQKKAVANLDRSWIWDLEIVTSKSRRQAFRVTPSAIYNALVELCFDDVLSEERAEAIMYFKKWLEQVEGLVKEKEPQQAD